MVKGAKWGKVRYQLEDLLKAHHPLGISTEVVTGASRKALVHVAPQSNCKDGAVNPSTTCSDVFSDASEKAGRWHVRPSSASIWLCCETTAFQVCRAPTCCWNEARSRAQSCHAMDRSAAPRADCRALRLAAPTAILSLAVRCSRSSLTGSRSRDSPYSRDGHSLRDCDCHEVDRPADLHVLHFDDREGGGPPGAPLRARPAPPPRRGGSRPAARLPLLQACRGSATPTASDPIALHVRAPPALSWLQSGARVPQSFRVRWDAPEFHAARRCS